LLASGQASTPPGIGTEEQVVMRSIVAVIVVLLAGAGLGGAYWYFVARPAQTAGAAGGAPAGFAMPIEAAQVRVGPSQRQIQAVGSLRSNESVILRPELIGRIAQINFTEGQKVKKGQLLVQLDAAVPRAELVQMQASLALAKANYDRAQELRKRDAGTERALDEARWKLRNDEAAVKLSEARLEKYALSAPFDGVVGLRKVSIGDLVKEGADLVNLEQVDPLKVDFRVPEVFLASLKVGQRIAVTVDALPGREFSGEVYAIDPLVDANGRAVVIRARIGNTDDALRPGLFARVALVVEERQEAVFVPEQSLVPINDQLFVFKVVDGPQGGKVVAFTKVKLGERRKGEAEVIDGLKPGDVVVSAGLLKVRDGMPVQVLPPPAAPPAANKAPNVADGSAGKG
jgi:membrane fusion protein, multidrug efflux system